ncbi:MAG: hypothetical protein JSS66_18850 [Armatimonadetes bacterium]|nr:hypothetical protein [Armatimonadota bacterium]
MTTAPILTEWTGDAFRPIGFAARECDKHFVVGQRYRMAEYQDRSAASHAHEFAWLKNAWRTLPDDLAAEYPSPEHLRKRALIQAGFYDEQAVDAGSRAAALRVASMVRSREEFAYVIVNGPIVLIRTAKSQSRRAMDKAAFQASKTAIMDVIAAMLGVEPETLARSQVAA